jgi:hypothetical protein
MMEWEEDCKGMREELLGRWEMRKGEYLWRSKRKEKMRIEED